MNSKNKKILLINGANLNMLGIREPDKYGGKSLKEIEEAVIKRGKELKVSVDTYQSNIEGEIVDKIQQAYGVVDGIVINPAAYTHTSVAILDALKSVGIPAVEVHISDVTKREDFRQISYAGMACEEHIIGKGLEGYHLAMQYLCEKYK